MCLCILVTQHKRALFNWGSFHRVPKIQITTAGHVVGHLNSNHCSPNTVSSEQTPWPQTNMDNMHDWTSAAAAALASVTLELGASKMRIRSCEGGDSSSAWCTSECYYSYFIYFLIYALNRLSTPESRIHASLVKKHCSKESELVFVIQQAFFLFFLCAVSMPSLLGNTIFTQTIAFHQQSFLLTLRVKLFFITQVFSRIILMKDKMLWANDGSSVELLAFAESLCCLSLEELTGFRYTVRYPPAKYFLALLVCFILLTRENLSFHCHSRALFVLVCLACCNKVP